MKDESSLIIRMDPLPSRMTDDNYEHADSVSSDTSQYEIS